MSQLSPFSGLKAQCVKCGCVETAIKYCVEQWPVSIYFGGALCPQAVDGNAVEHFHRSCKACGFAWMEAVPPPKECFKYPDEEEVVVHE